MPKNVAIIVIIEMPNCSQSSQIFLLGSFASTNSILGIFSLIKSPYKYLPDEIHAFFELVSTITRTRKNYKIIIIGNNADIFNIYFDYFKVPSFDGIYVDKTRGLYCELSKINPDLLKVEQETPLYKLVNGTPYGEYHYNNKPLTKNFDYKIKLEKGKNIITFKVTTAAGHEETKILTVNYK